MTPDDDQKLHAALDAFRHAVAGVSDVIAVAGSGLLRAASSPQARDRLEHLAATVYQLNALVRASAQILGGSTVLHTTTQRHDGYQVLMTATDDLHLLVLADASCDIGTVVHDLCLLCDDLTTTTPPG